MTIRDFVERYRGAVIQRTMRKVDMMEAFGAVMSDSKIRPNDYSLDYLYRTHTDREERERLLEEKKEFWQRKHPELFEEEKDDCSL